LNKRSFKGDEILVAGAPIEALDKNTLLWVERWSQIGGGKRRYSQEWLKDRQRSLLSLSGQWL
jgi:hypothetical protein